MYGFCVYLTTGDQDDLALDIEQAGGVHDLRALSPIAGCWMV